ncbi:Cellobiose 2-epimerase [Emticicia aquatica]|uniref:Cellobiose 2-epimerase n=1 Tax=Emticicia aquatica TaxID=1681835 RepID=A0ABM9AN29_9BACT|nr:AGE family epimerase/isomerase [Emticicia aquatica]CAH0995192.1 Cellobiose 2-epimerase [Emticicia aquatica]
MKLVKFKTEIKQELDNILQFWIDNSLDNINGGYVGKMDNEGIVHQNAEKGGVLNARILWTFSAAYNQTNNEKYLQMAHRAYQYINQFFRDKTFGGTYWSVDTIGNPANTRKQIYGLAFMIYGLSEYYKATKLPVALDFSIELYELLELYSFDKQNGGYFEAFSEEWNTLEDLRLSEKDRNDPKTMNTHLHIIEAYVNLYNIWENEKLKTKIKYLLDLFDKKIINNETKHLTLFFSETWEKQSDVISYGHDIEATWLLFEAAEVLKDEDLIRKWKKNAVEITKAVCDGFNRDGSLNHEYDSKTNHLDSHREWWVSAEAMVGFYNTYQITKDEIYLEKVFHLWDFIKIHLLDRQKGEWFWGVFDNYLRMNKEDKIGFWKCPYHNARACMELIKRI